MRDEIDDIGVMCQKLTRSAFRYLPRRKDNRHEFRPMMYQDSCRNIGTGILGFWKVGL